MFWIHFLHYFLHLVFPFFIAFFFFRKNWKNVYLIFLLSMCIDLDHLFQNPIFDPNRCSIGFHFLHRYFMIYVYFIFLIFKKTRVFAFAILFHILTDYVDCLLRC